MKANEKQQKLNEEIASYIKGLTGGSDFDSPSLLSDMDAEIERISEEYELDFIQQGVLSELFTDAFYILKSIKIKEE